MNRKKNEEDFKNESSENKCQIKKQFTPCVWGAKGNSGTKNLTYGQSEQLNYLNIRLMLFSQTGGRAASR